MLHLDISPIQASTQQRFTKVDISHDRDSHVTDRNYYTLSNDTVSLRACNVVRPYETKPPTQVGSTSAKARNVKAASTRTYTWSKVDIRVIQQLHTTK